MNNLNKKFSGSRGLTLVEVIIATSIILAFLIALFGVHSFYLKIAFANKSVVKVSSLAEEGLEVTRFLRDSSWSTNITPLSLETDYYLVFENGTWAFTTTPTSVGNLERKVVFSAVYRDVTEDITSSGGTLDPNTLLVVSTVTWPNSGTTVSRSISTYITNIFDN